MTKKFITYISFMLIITILFGALSMSNVYAGALAEFFGIKDDTGGFVTDNIGDKAVEKLSDVANASRTDSLKTAMQKFKLSEKLRKTGKFNKASKYFRTKTTEHISKASRIGKFVKFLGGAAYVLNVYNTTTDTYNLVTQDSKHETMTEGYIDKALGCIDAGMGWYAVGAGAVAIVSAPTIGAGVVAAGAVVGTKYVVTKIAVGATRIAFNSKTYRNISGFIRGKKKLVFAPFVRPGMKEGLDIIKEELGFDLYPGLKREIPDPSTGIPVYKPNIYIYNDEDIDINVKIYPSEWITESIPKYNPEKGWDAKVINGSLNAKEDFLFYEALVPDTGYQKKEGFIISGKNIQKEMEDLMLSYGFTEKETKDFVDFWKGMLDSNNDYIFYPQTTETLELIMPIVTDKKIDSLYRLWFYIEEIDSLKNIGKPQINKVQRNELTLVEWGGIYKD